MIEIRRTRWSASASGGAPSGGDAPLCGGRGDDRSCEADALSCGADGASAPCTRCAEASAGDSTRGTSAPSCGRVARCGDGRAARCDGLGASGDGRAKLDGCRRRPSGVSGALEAWAETAVVPQERFASQAAEPVQLRARFAAPEEASGRAWSAARLREKRRSRTPK
jgi:hypothetical protein